jgi:hypothetical protein
MLTHELVKAIQAERERAIRQRERWPSNRSAARPSLIERVRTELARRRMEVDQVDLAWSQEPDR